MDTDLLPVIGCVGEKRGHVEHQLIVFVCCVKRVAAGGVRWSREHEDLSTIRQQSSCLENIKIECDSVSITTRNK